MQALNSRKNKLTARLIAGAGSAVALAAGNAAYATVISFDNSALGFVWNNGNLLDITQDALDQPNAYNESSFYQASYWHYVGYNPNYGGYYYHDEFFIGGVTIPGEYVAGNSGDATVFGAFDEIGSVDFIGANSFANIGYLDANSVMQSGFNERGKYAGVSFKLAGNTHYGWIELLWNPNGWFDAYSWGYETTAEKPLRAGGDIPEPGTLGLFAVGVAALAVARRRRNNKSEEE